MRGYSYQEEFKEISRRVQVEFEKGSRRVREVLLKARRKPMKSRILRERDNGQIGCRRYIFEWNLALLGDS